VEGFNAGASPSG